MLSVLKILSTSSSYRATLHALCFKDKSICAGSNLLTTFRRNLLQSVQRGSLYGWLWALSTLTDVEEQDGPDRKCQSPQVPLSLRTPLKTNRQQVSKHDSPHLWRNKTKMHNNETEGILIKYTETSILFHCIIIIVWCWTFELHES